MALFKKNPAEYEKESEERQYQFARENRTFQAEPDAEDQIQLRQGTERQDLLKWQQDLEDELEMLKHNLKGEILDEKKGWIPQPILLGINEENKEVWGEVPPLINDIGIRMIESAVRPLLNRNLINSNLSEDFVRSLLLRTANTLVNAIAYYGECMYAIEFGNYSLVKRMVMNTIIPTPFRAVNGWNKKMDSTISKRIESFTEGNNKPDEKKKLFGIFPY